MLKRRQLHGKASGVSQAPQLRCAGEARVGAPVRPEHAWAVRRAHGRERVKTHGRKARTERPPAPGERQPGLKGLAREPGRGQLGAGRRGSQDARARAQLQQAMLPRLAPAGAPVHLVDRREGAQVVGGHVCRAGGRRSAGRCSLDGALYNTLRCRARAGWGVDSP